MIIIYEQDKTFAARAVTRNYRCFSLECKMAFLHFILHSTVGLLLIIQESKL